MIFALVLAGGSGTRFGTSTPKQFLEICKKPVIIYSIEAFCKAENIDGVIAVVPKEYISKTRDLICAYGLNASVAAGGADRNESLMNGIRFIERAYGLDEDTVVLTHDAARPFVTQRIISDNIYALNAYDACDTCIPVTDTVIQAENGVVRAMPERKTVYQCQTPQTFRAKKLYEYYYSLSEQEKSSLTDAGKIFFLKGEDVKIVNGHVDNIKITYPGDLSAAEIICKKAEYK